MDGLEQAIGRAESFEREQGEKADEFAASANPGKPDQAKIPVADPVEAAGNMAETLLNIGTRACQAFIDNRLSVDEAEIKNCRESMAPVINKYNLAIGGGKIPYTEEVEAGLYMGGLWRRFRRALTELKAKDKAEKQARDQANGDQRKHQFEKPQRVVSGNVGNGQECDAGNERWNSESWGQSGAVGPEQGS